MSFAIGMRFYKFFVYSAGKRTALAFNADGFDPFDFFSGFVDKIAISPVDEGENQRTWFFERKPTSSIRSIHGYVNYGTHGFESSLKDTKTRSENYRRKASDLEEIPLYFQFWVPSNEEFGMACFQSFQGRSCVGFVIKAIQSAFEKKFKGKKIGFHKVMPNSMFGSAIGDAPVKEIRLTRNSAPSDPADALLRGLRHEEFDYEVSLRAKRKRSLGLYKDIQALTKKLGTTILVHEGVEFSEMKAEVQFRGKRRMIGLFGYQSDAGVIEVSEKVRRGSDGHPVFSDIANEVDGLMEEFFGTLKT